jgi:hypothetical protein
VTRSLTTAHLGAAARHSAPVTHWGGRIVGTALTLLFVALVVLLMRRGWLARARRQGEVPPLPSPPDDLGRGRVSAEGSYVSTTTEGDWLDRIVVHGLGAVSNAVMTVADRGVLLDRVGAPDVFLPATAICGVRLERGMAGKFVEEGGILVLTWRHGTYRFDTGFRPRHADDTDLLVDAVTQIVAEGAR